MSNLGQSIIPIFRVRESKRKPVAQTQILYREEVWAVKVSVAWCQPIGLMQVAGTERNVVVSAAL